MKQQTQVKLALRFKPEHSNKISSQIIPFRSFENSYSNVALTVSLSFFDQ